MDLRAALRTYGDAVLAVGLALTMTLELLAWADPDSAAALGAGLLATLPVVLRRRSPVAMFLLVAVGLELLGRVEPGFDNDSMSLVVVFFVSLYSLGRHTHGLEAWLGAGLLTVEAVLFVEGDVGLTGADLGDIAFTVGFLGAPWGAGLAVRLRQEREGFLRAEHERQRAEQQERALRAVAEERARIARELHDVVAHAISVTVLQARGARRTLDTDPEAVRRALHAIEQTNAAALGDMRRLLAVLRDTEPAGAGDDERGPQPSLVHLDELVSHVRASGVPVVVEQVGEARELPPGVDLSAYRIVQEALTNVLKHAADARATVRLEYSPEALTVLVSDDGIPGPLRSDPSGHGLIGIRERVSVVGGQVEAGPGAEGGFTVRARLPYALEVS
jgi:signal transduction histidine kinase